jgi:hypothetical protein
LAGESGTVNVDVVVVPPDGAIGDDSLAHPTATMLRPMRSAESRIMMFLPFGDSLRRISERD